MPFGKRTKHTLHETPEMAAEIERNTMPLHVKIGLTSILILVPLSVLIMYIKIITA